MRARLPGLVLCLIALLYGSQAVAIPVLAADAAEPMTARSLPMLLSGLLGGIGLWLLVRPEPVTVRLEQTFSRDLRIWLQAAGLLVLCLLFAVLIGPVGVLPTGALVLLAGLWGLGVRRPVVLAGVPAGVVMVLWVLLEVVLGIYLHPGDLWRGHV